MCDSVLLLETCKRPDVQVLFMATPRLSALTGTSCRSGPHGWHTHTGHDVVLANVSQDFISEMDVATRASPWVISRIDTNVSYPAHFLQIRVRAILNYLLRRLGPLTTTGCDHGAFVSTLGACPLHACPWGFMPCLHERQHHTAGIILSAIFILVVGLIASQAHGNRQLAIPLVQCHRQQGPAGPWRI